MPPASAFDPRIPFTRADAIRHGLRDHDLHGPRFRRIFVGVYVDSRVRVTATVRAVAALRICPPGSYISHLTAAQAWDLCPPAHDDTHVSVPRNARRPQRAGLRVHLAPEDGDVVARDGMVLSSPVQTFLELATEVGLVDLVIVGDRVVRRGHATPEQLVDAASRWTGRCARLALRAARLVRSGVDSPMETRLRLLLVLAGLPEPEVNVILRWPDGEWEIRIDLAYPRHRIMIEYDGRQHAETTQQWRRDLARREWLDEQGWRLIVVTAEGIFDDPGQTLARVHRVLRDRRVPGVPRGVGDGWRRYFPGRPVAA